VVINDSSRDATHQVVLQRQSDPGGERIILIDHQVNTGKGRSVIEGFQRAHQLGVDVLVTMDGDAQMDPLEMPYLLDPIVLHQADYIKGNRLSNEAVLHTMPRYRFYGNHFLTLMTKIASGYWYVDDAQGGYTALSRQAFDQINFNKIQKNYEFENSMLIQSNILGVRVLNVPVRPIYGVGEISSIIIWKVAPHMAWYLFISFFKRILEKYLLRGFHSIILIYSAGFLLGIPGLILVLYLFFNFLQGGSITATNALLTVALLGTGLASFFLAVWQDMLSTPKINL
jgi:hypothetical protein